MEKSVKIGILVVVLIIIFAVYYYYMGDKFTFIQGMDIPGNDMPEVNLQFRNSGASTVERAKTFALGRPDIVGFVKLNTGEIIFKSAKTPTNPPCYMNLCSQPGSGVYIKK